MSFVSWCFCVVLFCFCTGHFDMVPLNVTCLQCLKHSFFEHFFQFILSIEIENATPLTPPYA